MSVNSRRVESRVVLSVFCLLAGLGLAGCDQPSSSTGEGGPKSQQGTKRTIVCTTGMVADLVRHVAQPVIDKQLLEVVQLMSDEADPHLYKTSPGDILKMQKADAIVYSGLHLEGKMGQIFENLSRTKKILAVAEQLPDEKILKMDEHFPDPHVWFDVELWSSGIPHVAKLLGEMFPEDRGAIDSTATAYQEELKALHERCKTETASIPDAQRVLITAHDAFHYWGRAYGIEVKAIQGISTESEAGVRQINELVKFIAEHKIKAVFVETTVSDRAVLALIEGCGQAGHKVVIGGSLYSDAMGKAGTPEGTYPGMVEHNLKTIVQALK